MQRFVMALVAVLGCAGWVWGAGDQEGFVSLFDGKGLGEWVGEAGWWSVQDGAITGITTAEKPLKRATYLMWRGAKYGDFELRATYRLIGGNSGINFRSTELPNWDVKGYQGDMEAGPSYTGILYECNGREIMCLRGQKTVFDEKGNKQVTTFADAKALQKQVKDNDWNEYVIIAKGPEITIKVNGVVMSQVVDLEKAKAAREGTFTLQLHPGPPMKVQFREIRVKAMKAGAE